MADKKSPRVKESDSREKLFCYHMAYLGSAKEAAIKAGYNASTAENEAVTLLENKSVRRKIREWRSYLGEDLELIAAIGLGRLIFTSNSDILRIACEEEDMKGEGAAILDTFHVSEIKKQKGGVEIRLFDKIKAAGIMAGIMESIAGRGGAEEEGSLIKALEKSALAVAERKEKSKWESDGEN